MYLNELNKEQKKVFWKLANKIVMADGKVTVDEIKMLEEYKNELKSMDFEIKECPDIVSEIIDCVEYDNRVKKIILFELVGLAYSDNDYDQTERKLILEIKKLLGATDDSLLEIEKLILETSKLYGKIGDFINAD